MGIIGPKGVPFDGSSFELVESPRLPVAEDAISGLSHLPPGVGATSNAWSNTLQTIGFQEQFEVEGQQVIVRGLGLQIGDRVKELLSNPEVEFIDSEGNLDVVSAIRFLEPNATATVIVGNEVTKITPEKVEPMPRIPGDRKIERMSSIEQFMEMILHYVKYGKPPPQTEYDIEP